MLVSADEWVVDVLDHVAEHSDGVGRDFTKEHLLVAGFVDVDLSGGGVTFFLFSGRLRRNQTALSLIFSLSP